MGPEETARYFLCLFAKAMAARLIMKHTGSSAWKLRLTLVQIYLCQQWRKLVRRAPSMKTILLAVAVIMAVLFGGIEAQAQKSRETIGDGGTSIQLLQTGRVTLVAGVATVANTKVAATSNIFVERQTIGGTAGQTYDITRTAGTSFTITARAADGTTAATGDTSTIAWFLLEPSS